MSISGQQTILIGLPNESVGSDSLYTAFTKINNNFDALFSCSSPYNTFTASNGIGISSNANTGIVTITNTGVTSIVAGANITISNSNGQVTISSNGGGGNGGGLTSVGIIAASNARLTVTGSPLVNNGNILLDLANSGVTQGTYSNPTVSIDSYGRITSAANGNLQGTVTSVGLTPGNGIQITGGPVTSNGTITVTNTGVTRISAGAGIQVSGNTGNITISAPATGGSVTSIAVSSNSLTVSGSPITTSGTISINLPNVFAGTLTTAAQPNITSVGTLTSLNVTGNATAGNVYANAGIVGANVVSANNERWTSSEDLASGAAANLSVIASYFTTTAAETATLAAGTNGQIKTFMMVADGGDMVITVTNPGWGGAGTMTFSAVGQGCTLQYINSKWFCIGNNGVSFA